MQRLLTFVGARRKDVVLATAVGSILAVGLALTIDARAKELDAIGLVNVTFPACDPAQTSITLNWHVANGVPPTVASLNVGAVPANCATGPITVSLTDEAGAVLASVTNPGLATADTAEVTVAFDFSGHDVPAEPVRGVRADVPDPVGAPAEVPPGSDVGVVFSDPDTGTMLALNFSSILSGGGTVTAAMVTPDDTGYVPPSGFMLGSPATYFDISTTAIIDGAVEVCTGYDPASFGPGALPSLFHHQGDPAAWYDVTTSRDLDNHWLCGSVTSLSPFALGVGGASDNTPPTATITSPSSPTAAAALIYTITFDEAVTDLDATDISATGVRAGCIVDDPQMVDDLTATVRVTSCPDGRVDVALNALAVVDAYGNAGPAARVTADPVIVDRTAPRVTKAPATVAVTGVTLAGTGIPLRVAWAGTDGGSGIATWELARSSDSGKTWSVVATGLTSPSANVVAPASGTIRYRARAIDKAGNASAWSTGPVLRPALVQNSSILVIYRGSWRTHWNAVYSGGSARYSTSKWSSATFAFTGRTIAYVATKSPSRGMVRIYIDGVYTATVDLSRTTAQYRSVVWQKTWATPGTHVIAVVAYPTTARPRVDLDAFAVVR